MKSFVLGTLCVLGLLASVVARACTLAPGYGEAEFRLEVGSSAASPPRILLAGLSRGFDDGDTESCSSYGELRFVIDEPVLRLSDAYRFRTLAGGFPDNAVPEELIVPIDLGNGVLGFVFRWRDVEPGAETLAPINAIVTVQAVSQAGAVSASTAFRLHDAGGPVATIDTPTTAVLGWVTIGLVVLPVVVLLIAYSRRRRARQRLLREIDDRLSERENR